MNNMIAVASFILYMIQYTSYHPELHTINQIDALVDVYSRYIGRSEMTEKDAWDAKYFC